MTQKRRRSKSRVGLRKQERMKKAQVVIDVPSQNDTKKAQVVIDVSSCVRKKLRTDTEVRGANGTTVWTFKTGVSKLRPAGQMRPAKPFHPARVAILSMMKK